MSAAQSKSTYQRVVKMVTGFEDKISEFRKFEQELTDEQKQSLETYFQNTQREPDEAARQALATQLGMHWSEVNIEFYNFLYRQYLSPRECA